LLPVSLTMTGKNLEVDLVYLWVDGNDPKWQEKKRIFTGRVSDASEQNNLGRYVSNDELRYALRSVEKHTPWIRKIFIVTDDQQPEWLDKTNPKIHLVDHKDIMPAEILPCFNSNVIEYFLYKIPGLSECFLLANDDMFFNADLSPDFFFAKDGFPIVRLKRRPLGKWHYRLELLIKKPGQYNQSLIDAASIVEKKFGKYYPGYPHHNVDAYRKSDYRTAVEEIFAEQIENAQHHRIRAFGDLQRLAFMFYVLAIGHGHLKYVERRESKRIPTHKSNLKKYIDKYQPKLFCLNDSQRVTDEHRKKIKPFLETLFPTKSAFEKS
jgi:Stealth protein CR2, conserved region 2/Stealth protein CR1, conserved region 1/Stealth protein CR4, conserved region 4